MPRKISALVLVATLALVGCRTASVYNPQDIAFATPAVSQTAPLTLDDYKRAIIRGGAKRNWTFEEAGPGHLIGNVAVRGKHFATVDIVFDTQTFSITHKSSQNLKYDPAANTIHSNYNAWITNLQNDIQAEITLMKAG